MLQTLVHACESEFAGCGLSYYLIGSWADGDSHQFSDVDVVVVWTHGDLTKSDRGRWGDVLAALSPTVRLDAVILPEREIPSSLIGVNLKLSSKLVYGADIRERLPLPPFDAYTDSVKVGAHIFMSRILRGVERLGIVDYPDPNDEFFGYAVKRVDAWYPSDVTCGLKEWVSTATRIARALVALQGGRYVGSKGGAIAAYRELVGDEWGEYLVTVYAKGKREWAYRVPEPSADRALLRELCRRFLDFEKHFILLSQQ